MEFDSENKHIESIKLINFGCSFKFASDMQVNVQSPEYASPELLAFIVAAKKNMEKKSVISSKLKDMSKCSSFDVWSLGVILCEIISGCPVWLYPQSNITSISGKPSLSVGIFGAKDHNVRKIIDA